jgi:hypothetical protein
MSFLSQQTRRIIKDSFQTFIIAILVFAFAFLLTFVEDFAVKTNRPKWAINGIEGLSVLLFIGDGLVILAVVARIVLRAYRDLSDEFRKE